MKQFFSNTGATHSTLTTAFLLALSASAFSAEEPEEHAGGEHEEGVVELSPAQARENGIVTAQAGPGVLERTLLLFGLTVPDPEQLSHVTARYPGLIRSIGPSLGDMVQAGETIAAIEASSSLQTYKITAPISGTVVEKHANPGEIAGENSLLTIADYSRLWVDLSVFPTDAALVKPGQEVRISMNGLSAQSTIRYLNPGEGGSPTVTARVPLPNPGLAWTPGLLVEGHVTVAERAVDLLVDNRAIQSFEDRQGVFVQQGEHYAFTPLVLGESNGSVTEVLEGLEAGDSYAVENSYLLKADLEKAGASHAH